MHGTSHLLNALLTFLQHWVHFMLHLPRCRPLLYAPLCWCVKCHIGSDWIRMLKFWYLLISVSNAWFICLVFVTIDCGVAGKQSSWIHKSESEDFLCCFVCRFVASFTHPKLSVLDELFAFSAERSHFSTYTEGLWIIHGMLVSEGAWITWATWATLKGSRKCAGELGCGLNVLRCSSFPCSLYVDLNMPPAQLFPEMQWHWERERERAHINTAPQCNQWQRGFIQRCTICLVRERKAKKDAVIA